jgi:hypothetical protein
MNPQRVMIHSLSILLLAAGSAFGQAVDSNVAVSSFAQSRGDPCSGGRGSAGCGGCYPGGIDTSNPLSLLATVNPEWQPIGPMISGGDPSLPPDSEPVLVTGTVELSKVNVSGDFPSSHIKDDQNTFIMLDPDKSGLIATGNSESSNCPGENCGLVEMEREIGKYPLFAWAGEGDRITALGRWIFDCGHPDPDPVGKCSNSSSTSCTADGDCPAGGTCTGANYQYRAELHPPQAVAVMRDKSIGKTPATRADVYVSADAAGASDRCTVTHLATPTEVLTDKTCFINTCSKTTSQTCQFDADCPKRETCTKLDPSESVLDVNASDFEFDMLLPPKPAGATDVKIKIKKLAKKYLPKGSVSPKKPVITPHLDDPIPTLHVSIPMTVPIKGKMPDVFAQSISAAWKKDKTKLTHVQVRFTGFTINNALKPTTPVITQQCTNVPPDTGLSGTPCTSNADCPGAKCVGGITPGWEMFGQVNGDWIQFSGLDAVTVPVSAPQKFKFDEYVAADGAIHIATTGHVLNCIDTLYGTNLIDGLNTYGLTIGANCLLEGMDPDPGRIDVTLTGPTFTTATGSATTCSTAGKLSTCTTTATGGDAGTCTNGDPCITSADCQTGETCTNVGGSFSLSYTIKVK